MATDPPSPPHYEPKPRWRHCGALVKGKWITYGGHFGADGGVADPPTSVDIFDPNSESWELISSSGAPPSGVCNAACITIGNFLYHICGVDGNQHYNTIHCLDTRTKIWTELRPANPEAAPMPKTGVRVILHGSNLITFGGYGPLPTNHHPGVQYIPHPKYEGGGWTNEVVCYDTEQSEYVCHQLYMYYNMTMCEYL